MYFPFKPVRLFHVVSYPLRSVLGLSFGTLFSYVVRPFFGSVSAFVSVSVSNSFSVSVSIPVSVSFGVSGSALLAQSRSGSRSQTELAITRVDDFACLACCVVYSIAQLLQIGQLATCSSQLATASIIIQIYKKTIKNKFLEHKSTKLISFQLKLHAGSG